MKKQILLLLLLTGITSMHASRNNKRTASNQDPAAILNEYINKAELLSALSNNGFSDAQAISYNNMSLGEQNALVRLSAKQQELIRVRELIRVKELIRLRELIRLSTEQQELIRVSAEQEELIRVSAEQQELIRVSRDGDTTTSNTDAGCLTEIRQSTTPIKSITV